MVGFSRRVPSPNSHRTDGAPGVGCHSNGTSLRWRKSRMAYASGDPGRPMTHQRGDTVAVLIQRNLGMLVLAIWLILYGLSGMVSLGLPAPLMGILALIAGAVSLAGR